MDRLSTLDAEFLHLEDGIAHLHIAGIAVFDGPAPSQDDLCALIAAKLHRIPRYRQRVRSVPLDLGRPVWVDDPHFRLGYHVRHTALPSPGDDAALCRLMGRLMSQPLDRDRPLWETWLVEGLADGRWAVIFKVHHCMVDGISGVGLLTVLLDLERDAPLPEPPPWTPEPEPDGAAKVIDAWQGLVGDVASLAGRLPELVRDPLGALRSARHVTDGLVALTGHLGATPATSIVGPIGPHRSWAHAEVAIDDVRTIRAAFGGTLNDVVLSALAGAYRHYLASRGDDPDQAVVRTLVPVSVRGVDGAGVPDNRVSAILLELPVDVADPLERLEVVEAQMAERKGSHMAEAGEAVTTLGQLAPPMVVGGVSQAAVRLVHRLSQRSLSTVTTNVPGPQVPLYCLGRTMRSYHPFVPIYHGVRVGTAILSYDGWLSFGITGDEGTADDVAVLAEAVPDEIATLVDLAGASR